MTKFSIRNIVLKKYLTWTFVSDRVKELVSDFPHLPIIKLEIQIRCIKWLVLDIRQSHQSNAAKEGNKVKYNDNRFLSRVTFWIVRQGGDTLDKKSAIRVLEG